MVSRPIRCVCNLPKIYIYISFSCPIMSLPVALHNTQQISKVQFVSFILLGELGVKCLGNVLMWHI